MSRTKKTQPQKPKFDTKPYEKPGLSSSDILQIKEIFDMFDKQHCGSINPKDLKSSISALGHQAKAHCIYQLIVDLCAEGQGNISFEEFIHLLTPRLLQSDSPENIDRIFALFDTSKAGYISVVDLRRIANEMGFECSEQDLRDMIKKADSDRDGVVSRDEFISLIGGPVAQ